MNHTKVLVIGWNFSSHTTQVLSSYGHYINALLVSYGPYGFQHQILKYYVNSINWCIIQEGCGDISNSPQPQT